MVFRREAAKKQLDVNINPPRTRWREVFWQGYQTRRCSKLEGQLLVLLAADWGQEDGHVEIVSAVVGFP